MSEQTERYDVFGSTREQYLEGKHLVLESDGNWDYYANEDETQFFYVPHVGSTAWAGWFGDVGHFMWWLAHEREHGHERKPVFRELKLECNQYRYWDARRCA